MIIIDGVRYNLWMPKDEEKEFHPMVREYSKEIFGENSLYFDVKHILKSASGIGSIPDAYVISLSKPSEWYVVENELSTHPVFDHVVKQLTKFINGVENQNAKSQILDMLYEEINRDGILKATVKKLIDTDDIYHFLSKLLSKPPRIVIIIDEKLPELDEACRVLKYHTFIVEFKTYAREDAENVRAHLFDPLSDTGQPPPPQPPLTRRSWQEMLDWVDQNTRDVTKDVLERVLRLNNVTHRPTGNMYTCFKGKPMSESRFLGLFLSRKSLKVRIRTDPTTFKDLKKWTGDKTYHWFFKTGEEKEFRITEKNQIDYAMELIKQSYDLAK